MLMLMMMIKILVTTMLLKMIIIIIIKLPENINTFSFKSEFSLYFAQKISNLSHVMHIFVFDHSFSCFQFSPSQNLSVLSTRLLLKFVPLSLDFTGGMLGLFNSFKTLQLLV